VYLVGVCGAVVLDVGEGLCVCLRRDSAATGQLAVAGRGESSCV